MATITITIPEDLRVKLKEEENQSGLIKLLLKKHLQKGDDPKILKKK